MEAVAKALGIEEVGKALSLLNAFSYRPR